jgi:hypothetical protein
MSASDAAAIRPGEELDIASLARYLNERLPGPAG